MSRQGDWTVTCLEMKTIEDEANQNGLSYYQMMENAGSSAASIIVDLMRGVEALSALVFCGKGNNGGDGFVIARRLMEEGYQVMVVLVDGEPRTAEAIKNARLAENMGIYFIDTYRDPMVPILIDASDIIVDAIYGTGFKGELNEGVRAYTKAINRAKELAISDEIDKEKFIFSIDIPSGLNGDCGEPDSDSIRADYTIVFHRCKPVHSIPEAAEYCGKIVRAGIGLD